MYPAELPRKNRLSTAARQQQPGNPDPGVDLRRVTSTPRRAARAQHELPHRHALKREISVALAAKLILLTALWFLFFSHPLDRALGANDMDRVLLGPVAEQTIGKVASPSGFISKESRYDP